MANKISVAIEFLADKATASAKGFRKSIDDADGAFGKLKAGSASAFGAIQQHAAGMALAAGGALVAFGAKGVAAFTDLALEAGKFRDISGATLDEASRWVAVGDDIGLSGDTIASAFNKANIAIGSGKPILAEYGIEVKKTKDGLVDTNATMLNAIDTIKAIKDPTKKAELAAATFGKSWTELSELIEMGSDDITKAMGEVSDAQIIDDSEIAKAKKYRESMDKLKDSISDLAMNMGEELTPAVTVAADTLATIAPAIGKVVGVVGDAFVEMADFAYEFGQAAAEMVDALPFVDMPGPIAETAYEMSKLEAKTGDVVAKFAEGNPTMLEFGERLRAAGIDGAELSLAIIEYKKQLDEATLSTAAADSATHLYIDGHGELQGQLEDTTEDTDDFTHANDLLADKIAETTDRYADLKGELLAEDAFHDAEGMWADLAQSAEDAYIAAADGAEDAADKAFAHQGKVIDAKNAVVDLGEKYADLPEEEITRIVAMIDEGQLEEAERRFNILTRNREMNVSIIAHGGAGYSNLPSFDTGGVVPGPRGVPMLAVVHGGEYITPAGMITSASPAASYGGGSAVFNLNVTAGMGADGHEIASVIVNALGDFRRANGPGPLRQLTGV